MGKKDITLKDYLSDAGRYADLWNGSIFQGEQIIKADELSEVNTVRSKSDRRAVIERSNDIAMKQTADGKCLAVWLIANQETVDYSMPVRVMLQEALEYDRQLKEIRRERMRADGKKTGTGQIKEQAFRKDTAHVGKKSTCEMPYASSGEFLSRIRKHDRLHPVVTLVVYWGEEEWQGAKCLHDILDFGEEEVNEGELSHVLRKYVPEYPIHFLNLSEMNDYESFHTELRTLFELYARRNQKKEFSEYLEEHAGKIDAEICWALGQLTNSKELQNYVPKEREEKKDMCRAITELIADGRAEGKAEGLKALVRTLKEVFHDSSAVYEAVIRNEEYHDVTKEQVLDYYNS